ncbi:MAG: hypothetical protein HZA50_13395 [Planctomycetes bacterium]|nr:hypothetical protein [Planctomycetota bacterium]
MSNEARIILLHHSTGNCIWKGGVAGWFGEYNARKKTNYQIIEQAFPKKEPYGWRNYPFDYWNIWVEHAGASPFKEEPTLEMLTKQYDVIIWKHCFPVSHIQADTGKPQIGSAEHRLENFKVQYAALLDKMRSFPGTKFIVWTAAALVKSKTNEDEARRTKEFVDWAIKDWDRKGDNVFLWDFYALETEGGLYLAEKNAADPANSHPNEEFSRKAAPFFCQRIVDVIEGRGDTGSLTGQVK